MRGRNLWSAEQQALNAAGAARVAARLVSCRQEDLDLAQAILDAAHALEEAARSIRERRRVLLAQRVDPVNKQ